MILEAYCQYSTAKRLKEKGFNEPTRDVIWPDGKQQLSHSSKGFYACNSELDNSDNAVSCPTHQMTLAWLRTQGFYAHVEDYLDTKFFRGHIHISKNDTDVRIATKLRVSYEEATEDIINACLKIMV